MSIFDFNGKKKVTRAAVQSQSTDTMISEALIEVARSTVIINYFNHLIREYNKNIITLTKPGEFDDRRDEILSWAAKRDSLERIIKAAKDERESVDSKKQ